mmetsp:Transcript_15001/g.33869  ORF Transcript_15001/g.33869 Transcript_15001/m.33869 type:complete len:291 (-) Transcript_15001:1556-2428(-)
MLSKFGQTVHLCSFLGRRDFPLDRLDLGFVGGVGEAFVFVHGLLADRFERLLRFYFLHFLATHGVLHTIENAVDLILTFDQGQQRDDDGSSETPCDRHEDPESKVILGEHLRRDRHEWPDDGQDDCETPASDGDPLLHLLEVGLVLLFGPQSRQVLLHELNLCVQGVEVKDLIIEKLGVDEVNKPRRQNGDEVATEHDSVVAQGSNRNTSAGDMSRRKPCRNCQGEATPGRNDGSLSRGLAPSHHVPERNDSRSNYHAHEQVHPSKVEPHCIQCDGEQSHEDAEANDDNS